MIQKEEKLNEYSDEEKAAQILNHNLQLYSCLLKANFLNTSVLSSKKKKKKKKHAHLEARKPAAVAKR
jgi:hypothetical protein